MPETAPKRALHFYADTGTIVYRGFGAESGARLLTLHAWFAGKRGLYDGFGRFDGCLNMID